MSEANLFQDFCSLNRQNFENYFAEDSVVSMNTPTEAYMLICLVWDLFIYHEKLINKRIGQESKQNL